uniref:Uncharacterized protein n=1 Tax=Rhizophagus irregularis (strain DAOM 181602 / DAOM 197198 / MUCL 43194) TaxID=747089 RepID=U9TE19_RHIID
MTDHDRPLPSLIWLCRNSSTNLNHGETNGSDRKNEKVNHQSRLNQKEIPDQADEFLLLMGSQASGKAT